MLVSLSMVVVNPPPPITQALHDPKGEGKDNMGKSGGKYHASIPTFPRITSVCTLPVFIDLLR